MKLIFIIAALLLSIFVIPANAIEGKCLALALEGGGDMGSYEAGVIEGLVQGLPQGDLAWNVVSGVSAGSINGMAIALYAPGDETAMSDWLINMWGNMSSANAYSNFPGGPVISFFTQPGAFNSAPERVLLTSVLGNRSINRNFSIGTCDANRGVFHTFNYTNTFTTTELVEAVMCSSAMPAFFPFQPYNNTIYVDGGTINNIDIASAIYLCRELGYDDTDIIVDVIMCTAAPVEDVVANDYKSVNMLMRYWLFSQYSSAMSLLYHATEDFPDVEFRYVIYPAEPLPDGEIPMGFVPAQIQEMIQIGLKDAQEAISAGEYTQAQQKIQAARDFIEKKYHMKSKRV
jgi:predicted acylesterase/phospholipase RssA